MFYDAEMGIKFVKIMIWKEERYMKKKKIKKNIKFNFKIWKYSHENFYPQTCFGSCFKEIIGNKNKNFLKLFLEC